MLRSFFIALATMLLMATPAAARKGQQILDLFLQGAQQEIYRQQQREHEQRQRQELQRLQQQFVAEWHACHAGDVGACDRALAFQYMNAADRQVLLRKRSEIVAAAQEAAERARREQYEAEAAERLQRERTRREAEEKRQSEDAHRLRVEQQLKGLRDEREREKMAADAAAGSLMIGAVTIALLAGLGLLGFASRRRLQAAWTAIATKAGGQAPDHSHRDPPTLNAAQSDKQTEPEQPPLATTSRDTAGAIAAMELALAYIQEVQDAATPNLEDKAERKQLLNTLALAAKQLDLAQRLDPDAILEGENDGVLLRFTINELKAEALLLEGTTHQFYDLRRAIPALVSATELNPNSARAFFVLGLTHAANRSKAKAIAAFEQAVALEPKNIVYRKELNRVQNLSGAEIAAYHATRTAEKVVDNTVMAWNVFAVVWNVLTFPLRVLVSIFRMLRLHPFA